MDALGPVALEEVALEGRAGAQIAGQGTQLPACAARKGTGGYGSRN